jgi:hypothetical protein
MVVLVIMAPPETFQAEVNPGKEIAEIAGDFQEPQEVLREAIHNAYDAGATRFVLHSYPEVILGDRVLSLEFRDDGRGMDATQLKNFFGLGFSKKDAVPERAPIGFKGHGTKIFYQARRILVLTQQQNGERLLAIVEGARSTIYQKNIPAIELWRNGDASERAGELQLKLAADHGMTIRLVDYTANSKDLIDSFTRRYIEDYLRWFTVYGSFRPALDPPLRGALGAPTASDRRCRVAPGRVRSPLAEGRSYRAERTEGTRPTPALWLLLQALRRARPGHRQCLSHLRRGAIRGPPWASRTG